MKPLVDADILRYEIGFAAEAGWRYKTGDDTLLPPWEFVENCFNMRMEQMLVDVEATEPPVYYLSGPDNFRYDIAVTKPYKGTRPENKPWHFRNLTVYLKDVLGAVVTTNGLEADDLICVDHLSSGGQTIICSRDKDLRQVPGWFYSWELGKQPSFGPIDIPKEGFLILDEESKPKKLSGCGLAFFYAQMLMGDSVDNIPGCPGVGPVKAFEILNYDHSSSLKARVTAAYVDAYGLEEYEEKMLEQGRLLWMTRRTHMDGNPEMWEIGAEE